MQGGSSYKCIIPVILRFSINLTPGQGWQVFSTGGKKRGKNQKGKNRGGKNGQKLEKKLKKVLKPCQSLK